MHDVQETLLCTFTYSHTRGVFTGHFHNGASFDFIAAADSPLPTKLRNALQALMSKAHTQFKAARRGRPEMTDDEWHALMDKIAEFEATNGVTRSARKAVKQPKRAGKVTGLVLADLCLDL